MLLFEPLTTWRSRIVAGAFVVCVVALTVAVVNRCALDIRNGWF